MLVFISIGNFFGTSSTTAIMSYGHEHQCTTKQERLSDHDHDHDVDNVPDDDDYDHLDGNVC